MASPIPRAAPVICAILPFNLAKINLAEYASMRCEC